jgi:glutathione synthase/RimK-type ligase-like ATP-grasp enzyme
LEGDNPQPYAKIGPKKPVYDELMDEISKQADAYVAVGYENYPEPLLFSEAFLYLGDGKFQKVPEVITADVVLDRSAKISFPGQSDLENQKVLNASDFKKLCNNKWEFYQMFPDFCPKTLFASDKPTLVEILKGLPTERQYVVKPFNGLKGKGIEFGLPGELKDYQMEVPVLIQEFKETSGGVPGLTKGRHDLRVAVVDCQIVWATIRQPDGDNLLANVAQGGSITEIEIPDIPESVIPIVSHMTKVFREKYHNPLFAVDFGFEDGKPFIYEINDQIGFPLPEMKKNILVKSLAQLLVEKALL